MARRTPIDNALLYDEEYRNRGNPLFLIIWDGCSILVEMCAPTHRITHFKEDTNEELFAGTIDLSKEKKLDTAIKVAT